MNRIQSINNQFKQKKDLKLTFGGGILNEEQREFYEENGYIIVKNMFDDNDIEKWCNRFIEYADGKLQRKAGMQIVRDISLVKRGGGQALGEAAITKIQDWQDDEILFSFCNHPKMQQYQKVFCGDNFKSVHTMFINKPPFMGKSSTHPIHQDILYFPFRPADRIVAGWAALEDSDESNGSLVVYPGSHKIGEVEHGFPEGMNKAYWGVKQLPPERSPQIQLNMKKGDIVFFHPYLFHGSSENKSNRYRKSICCHFASAQCHYVDITGTFQEELAKDIMSYASKKFGDHLSYQDIWRFKSKLIGGQSYENGI